VSVCVTAASGSVVLPDAMIVSVTVTIALLRDEEVVVLGSVDVVVLALNVEDVDAELVESPDPEPVIPPVAPAASIIERAVFSLVQAMTVPLEVTDGSAKHCWVAGQLTCDVSNCPFTQEAKAPWTHVVSPSVQGPVALLFANWALSLWASRALLSRVAAVESSDAVGAE